MSVEIEGLEFQVEAKSDKGADGIDKLANSFKNLKSAIKGGTNLNGSIKQFEKLNQADLDKQKQITANKDNIESLKEYKEKLDALIHLEEVDQLWTDVEACTTRIDEREKKEEELVASIQKNSETADKKIDEAVATLTKRVQYAYWIAAGSAGLAVVELILLLTRMI